MTSFAFTSDTRFLKADAASDQPYAVAGIAWDGSTTNRPGARFGPRALRQTSHMLCDGTHPLFDVSPLGLLGDAGDLPLPNTSLTGMRAAMAPLIGPLLRRHHMAWLGGDHSITLPLLRAYREWLGQPLAVIHFDAHCDTWTDHFGEPSGHGTWVAEAMQEGLVLNGCFTQIGIRSAGERAAREYVRNQGGQIFTARDLRGLENPAQLAPVLQAIRARLAAHGHPPVYLSLDIDCLDPAFAPGTGTPEPGGLSTNQVLTLLEELADLPFVGMDCVEVAPPYDHAELTSYAAANFVWTYLCGRIARAGAPRRRTFDAAQHGAAAEPKNGPSHPGVAMAAMPATSPRPAHSSSARPARSAAPPLPPFEALDRTHLRVMEVLTQFDALLAHLDDNGPDAVARASAAEICSFFSGQARQHHADEERFIFPALLAQGDAVLTQHVLRLQQDHGWLEEDWLELLPQIEAVATGYSWYDLATLRHALPIFRALYEEHIALEESLIYPEAKARQAALQNGASQRTN